VWRHVRLDSGEHSATRFAGADMSESEHHGELAEIERLKNERARLGCLGCTLPISTIVIVLVVALALVLILRYR
jgi:hypothetical protein